MADLQRQIYRYTELCYERQDHHMLPRHKHCQCMLRMQGWLVYNSSSGLCTHALTATHAQQSDTAVHQAGRPAQVTDW
jgi:hypothetical protein